MITEDCRAALAAEPRPDAPARSRNQKLCLVTDLATRRMVCESTHDDRREPLILCALHALDADEESEVRGHVRVCPVCRREFTQWLGAVGHIALLARPVAPPVGLRTRLLTAVEQVPLSR